MLKIRLPIQWAQEMQVGSLGSGKSPGVGNGNPLGNPMDRVVWRATVHGVAKSQT